MKQFKYVILSMIVLSMCLVLTACGGPESTYADAQKLMSKGEYAKAAEKFAELGDYEESAKLTMYCRAAAAGEDGNFDSCFAGFEKLGDYKESKLMLTYYRARQLEGYGVSSMIEAAIQFDEIEFFKDSKEHAKSCREKVYQQAITNKNKGNYELAISTFDALDSYRDSKNQILECKTLIKEEKYVSAMQYINEEKYEEAYLILSTIKDYKDVSNIILNNKNIAAVRETALTPFKKEGGYITLGAYYQSNSIAKEPIEWIVLKYDSETNRTLVVSRYALVRANYISDTSQITWKNSNIRAWLNRTFYAEAFSEDEKEVIPLVTLDGDETMDWVFCLSTGQIGYLGTEADSRCSPTAYAIEQGVWQYDGWDRSKQLEGSGCCYWWIRSDLDGWYMFISPDGKIYVNNENSGYDRNAVRPALWIDLNAM